jgi:protein-L-isoaspartate(D-aspartate) O-methyltransferase
VYVNFAVTEPAAPWVENLAPAGRLVMPLGVPAAGAPPAAPGRSARGAALLVERRERGLATRWLCPAFFVCAEGALASDEAARGVLLRAFERGGVEFVRSLRWKEPGDPGRCWLWSPRWSLCFDPVDGAGRDA